MHWQLMRRVAHQGAKGFLTSRCTIKLFDSKPQDPAFSEFFTSNQSPTVFGNPKPRPR